MFKKIGIAMIFIVMTLGITSTNAIAKVTEKQVTLKILKDDDKKIKEEIIDILNQVKSLDEAREVDREKICKYLGVDFNIVANEEKKGYSFLDSLHISRISNDYEFSIEDIEKLLVYYKDVGILEKELSILETIDKSEKIPSDYLNEFKRLLIDEFSIKEICSAFRIAKPLSVRIERIIKKDDSENNSLNLTKILDGYSEQETQIIENMQQSYFIDIEEVIKISEEQHLSISDLHSKVIKYEMEETEIDNESIISTSTTDDTGSNLDYSKYFNPPFIYERDKSENISLGSGGLTLNNIDYVLPGKNGLNLEIASKYDSSKSALYKESYEIKYEDYIYSKVTPDTYEELHNFLGSGWSLAFSSLEIAKDDIIYLHLGNGQVHKIYEYFYDFIFLDYKLNDMRFERDSSYYYYDDFYETINSSFYALVYKDGRKEYFSEHGSLLAIKDRYNNIIKFDYLYGELKITDTLGREVSIYDMYTSLGIETIISLPNNQTIKYVLETVPGHQNDYVLKKKIDQKNRETVYDYAIQEVNFSIDTKDTNSSFGAKNYYAILSKITYPTKAQSVYAYEKARENMGQDGSTEYFRIISRKDIDKNIEYNCENYSYSGNYSGFPTYYNVNELPNTYTYKTVVTNGSTSTTYIFNNKHLLINKLVEDNYLNLLKETCYEYDGNKLPIKEKEISYGQDAALSQKETSSEYDDYGDKIKYINELGGETYYQYDASYHIPVLIYNQADGQITNKVEYGIDPIKGNINWMKKHHFENGVDKSILIEYSYDTYGNILKEKLTQNDGKIIEKNYEYSSQYKNGYLTKTWTTIRDYENNVQTISELYTYDFNIGNRSSYTDGRGEKFVYEYDGLGRLTKEINPDLTYKAISYDDLNNITTFTNEKPFSVRQQYDGLGRLIKKEEQKDAGWVIIEERHYNTNGELDWTKDAEGNITYYQYDIFNRLMRTTFLDGTFTRTEYIDNQNMKIDYNEEGHRNFYIYDQAGNLKENWNERTDEDNIIRQHKISYQYDKFGRNKFVSDLSTSNTTEYKYDDIGRLTEVINDLNESTFYEYDNLDKITRQITAGGSITEKYYDELGRLIQEKDPLEKSEYTAYDANGNVIKRKDRNGNVLSYTYDDLNRLKTVGNDMKAFIMHEYEYDTTGNMVSAKDALGITCYEYYDNGKLRKDTSPDTKYIYYEYNNNGSRSRMIDHFGKETSYGYDLKGRLKTVTIDGGTTTYEYYDDGTRKFIQYPDGIKEEYFYDECNNLRRLVNKKADGTIISEFIYTYDDGGNQRTKTDEKGKTEYTYDTLGRIKSVLNPDGTKISYEYDRNGNVSRESLSKINSGLECDVAVSNYVYDSALYRLSHIIKETAKLNTISISPTVFYLSADQQITLTLSGIMNNGNIASDALLNNAVWTTDSSAFAFTSISGKVAVGKISKDAWDSMASTDVITIKATLEGKTAEAKVYKYTIKSISISPLTVYTLANQEMTFNLSGMMTNGDDISSELLNAAIWSTDPTKLVLDSTSGSSITCTMSQASWDLWDLSETIKIKVNLGELYSEANVVKLAVSKLTITPSDLMLNQLNPMTLTLSGEMSDGIVIPDEILNMAKWTCSPTGLPLSSSTGKSIEVGSRRQRVPTVTYVISASLHGKTAQATVKFYGSYSASLNSYSKNDSITPETMDFEDLTLYGDTNNEIREGTELLGYLETGTASEDVINSEENITTSSISANSVYSDGHTQDFNEVYSEQDNPLEYTMLYYKYDNNGNMIEERIVKESGEEVNVYEYNELNQLVQFIKASGITTYTYNLSSLRETKTNGLTETKYYYDGQNVIIETINNNFSARNIFGINPIARETNSSKLYYLYNGHADVVAMVDSNGNVINSYDYDIYGKIKEANESGVENPIRYAGQYYDDESDMYYLRARYYDAGLMRFISEDTNKGDVKDPLSLNLYTYCVGNPVKYIDSDGHCFMLVTAAIGLIGGGIGGAIYSYAKYGEVRWQNVATGAAIGGVIGLTGGAGASLLSTAGSATGITALASTNTVLTGLGVIGGATAGGGTIVIGQSMGRVITKAQSIGAEVYNGLKYYPTLKSMFGEKAANLLGKADNALWIINKMAQNYKIVDIGIDTEKALGNSSYILESILTFFYKNKEIAIEYMKGALN